MNFKHLFLVLVVVGAVFLPSLGGSFVNWDDYDLVLGNGLVTAKPFSNFPHLFTTHLNGRYYPLALLTYQIEHYFFGFDPIIFHLTNLFLHLTNVALLFYLLSLLSVPFFIAGLTALLFGIHPLQVESVAWIASRKDVLFALFYLAAIIFYFQSKTAPKPKNAYIFSIGLFVLSLFSKSSAATLPAILLLIDYYRTGKITRDDVRNKIPFFLLALAHGLLTFYFLKGMMPANQDYGLGRAFLLSNFALVLYIFKLIFPFHLSCIYPLPVSAQDLYNPVVWSASLSAVLVLYLFWRSQVNRSVKIGMLFFVLAIFPTLHFFTINNAIIFERFVYLPSIGIFLLMAAGYDYFYRKNWLQGKLWLKGLGFAYVLFLGISSWSRCWVWQNSEALWTDAIAKYPNCAVGYFNRGSYYVEQNRMSEAFQDLERGQGVDPQDPRGDLQMAYLYQKVGNLYAALEDYSRALASRLISRPDKVKAYNNRGNLLADKGRTDEALKDYSQAIGIDPQSLLAYLNRGMIYVQRQEWSQALADFNAALKIQPDFPFAVQEKEFILKKISSQQKH